MESRLPYSTTNLQDPVFSLTCLLVQVKFVSLGGGGMALDMGVEI